jgi:general secretion pathway protein C
MKRVLILTANAGLLVLCCFLASGIIADVAGALLAPDASDAGPTAAASGQSPRDRSNRQVILTRNLFNVSTLAPGPVVDEEEEYEKTKLPLRLLGTAAADDTALSWAAIEDLESKEHLVVRVDQEIKGGARVVRIERRRIVLLNAGRREELALEGDASPPPVRRTAASGGRPGARGNLARLAENRFAVNRSEVENLVSNPTALFSQARILPKYEGGQMVGVQVTGIKPGSLFEQAGIQNGDTITGVNGSPVTGPEGASLLMRQMTEGGDIVVEGQSGDGRPFTKTFSQSQP